MFRRRMEKKLSLLCTTVLLLCGTSLHVRLVHPGHLYVYLEAELCVEGERA